MQVRFAQYEMSGCFVLIVLVGPEFTTPDAGKKLISRIEPYFPAHPVMLLSVEASGFCAFAYFQTHRILALLQLDNLDFSGLDLQIPPPDPELPF